MTALILLSEWNASQIEFWKPIEEFPAYDVSNFGRVRSRYKQIMSPSGGSITVISSSTRLLKTTPDAWGYPSVTLHGSRKRRYLKTHRLVALAFLPNQDRLPEVNHINAIRADARLDNLEWCTLQENRDHATRNGLMGRGEKRWAAKFTEQDVRVIRIMARNGASRSDIARLFGCVKGRVRDVILYRTWRHVE